MRKALTVSALLLSTLTLGSVVAQDQPALPGALDPSRVQAGSYVMDSAHTQVAFTVNHFGFNNYVGLFGNPSGSLTIDPAQPEKASLTVEIPLNDVRTTSDKLDQHLKTPDFLDTAQFPTAKFVSTAVKVEGTEAEITGNLTLHGVTRPITIEAQFTGAGTHPMNKKLNIGFSGSAIIKRSDFGMGKYVPLVSDEVKLAITAAFEK
jgi:polyisoprenoid-binding protein YceI